MFLHFNKGCLNCLFAAEIPVVQFENDSSIDVTTAMVDVVIETTAITDVFTPTGQTDE